MVVFIIKKIFSLCLVFLCIFLAACWTPSYYYNYDKLKERVEKVEIIKIDEEHYGSLYLIAETIKVLDEKEMDELLLGLSKIEFKHLYGPPTGLNGYCIKMWRKSGDCEVVGATIITIFNNEEKYVTDSIKSCNKDVLHNLLSKFVEVNI